MRIAIVGSGIAGLAAAHFLDRRHEVVVFEAQSHVGGHTRTVTLEDSQGVARRVDTGFVVFNETTYPALLGLLRDLDVGWRDSDMSFSVTNEASGLEYAGSSAAALFAQPSNLLRPRFWGMLRDILRFNRRASELLDPSGAAAPTLGEYVAAGGYGRAFLEDYLVPMASAVWSSSPERIMEFPLGLFLRFFRNHRFLTADGHLTWKTVEGGSDRYVAAILERLRGEVHVDTPVLSVRRPVASSGEGVELTVRDPSGAVRDARFDAVVLAAHADQSLRLLADPSPAEQEILGAFPFVENQVVVHTDVSLLPRAPRARASWNYHVLAEAPDRAVVTYDMTRLQGLEGPDRFLVTLNRTEEVDPARIHLRFATAHPLFTAEGVQAQRRHGEISGRRRTHYCGAYWRNGFHEDGLWSALRVVRALDAESAAGSSIPTAGEGRR